ncbi:hypothetical protein KSX_79860 [Ktedonospora formicarum]|uniref:Tetratricopeptide repeat protein n=2 Tax=Ktedonospora formicarum TaxID=2778364 RepID=A0A8J3I9R0_9CHLR|nr:hypothetical protein KSX_79860 [Ktedonospora formicarum]
MHRHTQAPEFHLPPSLCEDDPFFLTLPPLPFLDELSEQKFPTESFMPGSVKKVEPLLLRALHIWERTLGPDDPLVAYTLYNLAEIFRMQGRYDEAQRHYQHGLRINEQCFGSEHTEVALILAGLANLYRDQGKSVEAEPLYQRALAIREQHLGPLHPETAQTLHDLAICSQRQGKLDTARSLAQRALGIRLQALGEAHPKTIETQRLSTQLAQEQRQTEK